MNPIDSPSSNQFAAVLARAENSREDLVELCARLVAARSVNPPGDTRAVADVVSTELAALGVANRLEWADPVMPSVVAEVDSGRPGPQLILNVHLDTMPPGDESSWSVPVWELTRRDGRLYGLGMGNMKGAVAAMIHAVALLAADRDAWCGRVVFTAVSDEVVFGENGAAHLLRTDPRLQGDALICGEGAGFRRLAVGEKGVLWLEVSASGDAGHSSSVRQGRSASARIAQAILAIDALNGYRGALPPELAGHDLEGSAGFELSANVGVVEAGTFIGQVATEARAEVDLRLPPGIDQDRAESLVRAATAGIEGIRVRRLKGWDPNWTHPSDRLTTAWQRASNAVTGAAAPLAVRLPASDASRWRRNGVPALCFGPQPTLSAGVDDYAEEDQVVACVALYTLAAREYLARRPREDSGAVREGEMMTPLAETDRRG